MTMIIMDHKRVHSLIKPFLIAEEIDDLKVRALEFEARSAELGMDLAKQVSHNENLNNGLGIIRMPRFSARSENITIIVAAKESGHGKDFKLAFFLSVNAEA